MKNKKVGVSKQLLKAILAAIGIAIVFFLSMLGESTGARAYSSRKHDAIDSTRIVRDSVKSLSESLDTVKYQLICEVDAYIQNVSKRSRMTGKTIVEKCLEAEYDIPLLLAQAHQETHFASFGSRNNVFGIYRKSYTHPDLAVSDYIELMKTKYIIDRTPEELIASNFSMEKNRKARYAEDPTYGKSIEMHRNSIHKNTEIDTLMKRWHELNKMLQNLKKRNELEIKPIFKHDSTKVLT